MEQGEIVHELIYSTVSALPGRHVLADETTFFEVGQYPRHVAPADCTEFMYQLVARITTPPFAKEFDRLHVSQRISEERTIQLVKLGAKSVLRAKEKHVEILGRTQAPLEETPIVGDAAKRHVALHDFASSVSKMEFLVGIFLAFCEREREKLDSRTDSVIQATAISDDILREKTLEIGIKLLQHKK